MGERQRVEILKVLFRGAKILILDEPTAVLVPQEVDDLFANLRGLVEQGATVIFISHKLDEVLLSCLFYLRLDIAFGLTMTALMIAMVLGGEAIVQGMPEQAVAIGIALFVIGWIFQFVGHYWEKRKPAFVDDLVGRDCSVCQQWGR